MTPENCPGWFSGSCFSDAGLSEAQKVRLAQLIVEEETRIMTDNALALTTEQKASLTARFADVKNSADHSI